MIAILSQHNKYIGVPPLDSEAMELSRKFVEEDGSAIPLFQKLGYFGKTFYDRKSTYSMNFQVCTVDYYCSVHDTHAFLGTCIVQNPEGMISEEHWIWADSAYPIQTWCIVPFKATRLAGISRSRNIYNKYLSKVMCTGISS
ncbi:hypothetical protein OG21DRAFT_1479528 [Imleria badia]|nr:hypothetical protein OG21DRAFT_1479528 [Imleria badia]